LGAQVDELGSYVLDQQRRQVDEEIQARERRAQLMSQLRDVANAPIPSAMSRQERAEFLDQLDREAAQREQAEQDSLARETDQAESRRLWDYEDRQRYDRRYPRTGCDCPGHTAWRTWRRHGIVVDRLR
jgi:FKBP-type peptidyl-prolyl cis-trans isomerase (trigger factor)